MLPASVVTMPGTQVGDGDGVTATNGEGVDELVAATVVEALGEAMNEDELDGVAGLVAVTDADVPLERVAVGVNVRVNDDVAVLDGDAPRLSDAVAVCVSVLLLKRDGVVEKVGVSDGDAPRDSDAVSDNDRVAVVVAVAVGVIVGVDPRLSDAVDVGVTDDTSRRGAASDTASSVTAASAPSVQRRQSPNAA